MTDPTTQMFQGADNLMKLGKWAYLQIPTGTRCKTCPLLDKVAIHKPGWHCELRSSYDLMYDEEGPIKDALCPQR